MNTKPDIPSEIFPSPVDMLLYCPNCGAQHVDREDAGAGWDNPPHRTHLCIVCKHRWRPADVPTNGVTTLQTHGVEDGSPIPYGSPTCFECGCASGKFGQTFKCGNCGTTLSQSY